MGMFSYSKYQRDNRAGRDFLKSILAFVPRRVSQELWGYCTRLGPRPFVAGAYSCEKDIVIVALAGMPAKSADEPRSATLILQEKKSKCATTLLHSQSLKI
jgi:hypothetical protein